MMKHSVLFAFCSLISLTGFGKEVLDRLLGSVNGEAILESDVRRLKEKLRDPNQIDSVLLSTDADAFYKGDRKALVEYLIRERLIDSDVKRQNLTATPDRIEKQLRDIIRESQSNREEFEKYLRKEGLSIEKFRERLKVRIERQAVIQSEVRDKIRVGESEILSEYLKKNPRQTVAVDEYSVAQIYFNPKKGGATAALDRAEKLQDKLKNGEAFDVLAEKYSEDPNVSQGGFLGSFKTGEFNRELEKAVIGLEVNQTTAVVQSKQGYHILKLLSKKVTPDPQFQKQKEKIRNDLFAKTFQRQITIWLQTKRDEASIQMNEI